MPKTDPLIRTKLRPPFIRPGLVSRPRLQQKIAQGLHGPLTLITAPAGFGKTTLAAICVIGCGKPVVWVWLTLDKDDNQAERFLSYLIAAIQQADHTIGNEAAHLVEAAHQAPPETILTSLINDLDSIDRDITLVLDDYQCINNQAVHSAVVFLLDHCPKKFHLLIAGRSDPPLPLTRLRARGQMVELRAADLRFTGSETDQYLNETMGLDLDAALVAALAERTEGWIVGLQMAALSMRDREDVSGFIKSFSGTNRYILDYLLEEVLISQPPEIQRFLLYTSILERLTAPLCDAILDVEKLVGGQADMVPGTLQPAHLLTSQSILEYLERANLFLAPLDDERNWYRYHHLFADLLRAQLQQSLDAQSVAQLHIRAAEWHAKKGSILDAIHHASLAEDDERVEHFIEQNYMELVSRGEQAGLRFWSGKLSKELVYRRPWLCVYEAMSHSWFGELDETDRLLAQAEKLIQSEIETQDLESLQGLLTYVKSRTAAMRGDTCQAIELCLAARQYVPSSNLALQLDTRITLGYEYFLAGDYDNANLVLNETIQSGIAAGAVINTVASACILARLAAAQGQLHQSHEIYQSAAKSIPKASGQHLGARALVEIGIADLLCEWNDLDAALSHLQQGLAMLLWWDKADDWILAYLTLARLHMARANWQEASEAVEKALQINQTRGVFTEARQAVAVARVKLWLAQGDIQSAHNWVGSVNKRLSTEDDLKFENELAQITCARVWIALKKPDQAIRLLLQLEENARSSKRIGRLIEILILEALACYQVGDSEKTMQALSDCLALAEPQGYERLFLDEGIPMRTLFTQWLACAKAEPLRGYASHVLSKFDTDPPEIATAPVKVTPTNKLDKVEVQPVQSILVEPLSQRELEVLRLVALGKTNQEIARQLIVSPGTVKAHTASIYRKLDVANRTEAATRARQLGILP